MSTQTVGAAGVEAVVESLRKIEHEASRDGPLKAHDGLACFDFLYTIITENVLRCVIGTDLQPGDPQFHDREFMAAFDIAFADRYLNGIGLGQPQDWQPKSWRVLLDHREDPDISPLIFAVAGVNAHVNFDLPFAVVTACDQMGLELGSGTTHDDYQLINRIFAEHMHQLRAHFEKRFARELDTGWVSRIENWVGDRVVEAARDRAWNKALELWPVRHDAARMQVLTRARDRWVSRISLGLFLVDRIPAAGWKAMHLVPGPSRRAAARGRDRTGRAELAPLPAAPVDHRVATPVAPGQRR